MNQTPIDLRSDTVTLPSPAMRQAMYEAELGDDGYGEDKTVTQLQEMVAARVGKEAALLTPSGCMANLVAMLTFCERGDEVLLGRETDMYLWEVGAMSAVGGIHPNPLQNEPDGTIDLGLLEANIREKDVHFPKTKAICLENTNTLMGGLPLELTYLASAHSMASRRGVPLYMDGARLFNAAVALKVDVWEITQHVDALMFCFSKGLSCPVGSILCGSQGFIEEALQQRKMLGGQMRQAGIIASAGIVALQEMVDRLREDHDNARLLAEGLSDLSGIVLKNPAPKTNMVFFKPKHGSVDEACKQLEAAGVRTLPMGEWIRAVTHYGIESSDIHRAVEIFTLVWA